ncbi:MAG: hypothetical protein QMD06_04220 [Candidatus Altarchaeum sp.]|nr:hypothetical protein [Candidatus Altarchaeum sp.]
MGEGTPEKIDGGICIDDADNINNIKIFVRKNGNRCGCSLVNINIFQSQDHIHKNIGKKTKI